LEGLFLRTGGEMTMENAKVLKVITEVVGDLLSLSAGLVIASMIKMMSF
jgi:hypothetical protein